MALDSSSATSATVGICAEDSEREEEISLSATSSTHSLLQVSSRYRARPSVIVSSDEDSETSPPLRQRAPRFSVVAQGEDEEEDELSGHSSLHNPERFNIDETFLDGNLHNLMHITQKEVAIDTNDSTVKGFCPGVSLLPHQIVGRYWMRQREDASSSRTGGILADDMGLGKTIQALTRIVEGAPSKKDMEDGWDPVTLIICPLALVQQWYDELTTITECFSAIIHQGSTRTTDPDILKRVQVVVTTYDTLRSEYGSNGRTKNALLKVRWFRVILDEAHYIKNRNSVTAKACFQVTAKFRWALTGTPLQNDISELYSLFKFLQISSFSNWGVFQVQISDPLKSGKNAAQAMRRLQAILEQVMLRRLKNDICVGENCLSLPQRNVHIISCPFSPLEERFYNSLEGNMKTVVRRLVRNVSPKNSYMSVLSLLLKLRQACNHPSLASRDLTDDLNGVMLGRGKVEKESDGEILSAFRLLDMTSRCNLCFSELTTDNISTGCRNICENCAPANEDGHQFDSAKIRMTIQLLNKIDQRSSGTEKTIIFSQFTAMLDLIQPFLEKKGFKFVRYDGSMKSTAREVSLGTIRNDPTIKVILISLKAGAVGLNLTACNNVILLDLWWNPAVEEQAFDRVHRVGQKRDVNIYKLKIDNTVEDRILELQDKKRKLVRATLSGNQIENDRMGYNELLALIKPAESQGNEE